MVEIFNGNWKINDVKYHVNKIFIFGDNDLRIGKGGQAIIRDLNNTIGIRTKKEPNNNYNSFYSDKEYDQNILKIKEDIDKILNKIKEGYIIVLSNGGYGTGLARLNIKAPKTFKYLCDELFDKFNFVNTNNL
jgi:hypothetical protein